MAKGQWETLIPEKEKEKYLATANEIFCDNEISKYIADESWNADQCANKASTAFDKGDNDEYHRFRGYQQQHLDRALELQKVVVERRTAHATQRTGNLLLTFTVVIGFAQIPEVIQFARWLMKLIG